MSEPRDSEYYPCLILAHSYPWPQWEQRCWINFFPQMCQSSSQAQLSLSLPMNSFFTVSALKSVWPSICCTYTFTMRSHILRVRVLWAWVVCSLTFLFFYDHRKTLLSLIGSADPGNLICFYQPA